MKKNKEGFALIITLIIVSILSLQLLALAKTIQIHKSAVEHHYQIVKVNYLAKSGQKIAETIIELIPEWTTLPSKDIIYHSLQNTYSPITPLDGNLYFFKQTTASTRDIYCIAFTKNNIGRTIRVFHYKKNNSTWDFLSSEKL